MKPLGQRIKEFRLRNLMTQEDAARKFGIGVVTVIRIEAGLPCRELTRAKIEAKLNQEKAA